MFLVIFLNLFKVLLYLFLMMLFFLIVRGGLFLIDVLSNWNKVLKIFILLFILLISGLLNEFKIFLNFGIRLSVVLSWIKFLVCVWLFEICFINLFKL